MLEPGAFFRQPGLAARRDEDLARRYHAPRLRQAHGVRPFDDGPFAPSGGTFFYVNQIQTTAVSNYNALQTSFTLRNRGGFDMTAYYTWSHSIDIAPSFHS